VTQRERNPENAVRETHPGRNAVAGRTHVQKMSAAEAECRNPSGSERERGRREVKESRQCRNEMQCRHLH